MRVAQPSTILAYLPLYLAIEKNNHELLTFDRADQAIEAVCKNQADLAIGDPFLFNYLDYEQKKIVIIGGFIQNVLHSLITFNPFLTTPEPKQLKNKKLACYPEPSTSFFLARQLKKQFGLSTILQTPFNTELGPLITLETDLAIVLEPNTTYALRNGARELLDFSHRTAAFTGFSTIRPTLKKNRESIREFLQDSLKGIHAFQTRPEKTLQVARKYFPLAEEKILYDSIQRLRSSAQYCTGLEFSAAAILEGLCLRNLPPDPRQAQKFFAKQSIRQPPPFLSVSNEQTAQENSFPKKAAGPQ